MWLRHLLFITFVEENAISCFVTKNERCELVQKGGTTSSSGWRWRWRTLTRRPFPGSSTPPTGSPPYSASPDTRQTYTLHKRPPSGRVVDRITYMRIRIQLFFFFKLFYWLNRITWIFTRATNKDASLFFNIGQAVKSDFFRDDRIVTNDGRFAHTFFSFLLICFAPPFDGTQIRNCTAQGKVTHQFKGNKRRHIIVYNAHIYIICRLSYGSESGFSLKSGSCSSSEWCESVLWETGTAALRGLWTGR